MRTVFADTFYFIALTNPRDQAHARAVAFTTSYSGRIVTTAWIVTECANFMCDPQNRQEFLDTIADIRSDLEALIEPPDKWSYENGLKPFASALAQSAHLRPAFGPTAASHS